MPTPTHASPCPAAGFERHAGAEIWAAEWLARGRHPAPWGTSGCPPVPLLHSKDSVSGQGEGMCERGRAMTLELAALLGFAPRVFADVPCRAQLLFLTQGPEAPAGPTWPPPTAPFKLQPRPWPSLHCLTGKAPSLPVPIPLPCPFISDLVPGTREGPCEGGGVGGSCWHPWGLPWFGQRGGRPMLLSWAEVVGAVVPVGFCGMWRASASSQFYHVVRKRVVILPTLTLNKAVLFIQS